ncbi:low temperature requirement protein A [Lactobacillus agrestimuris]|uniref:low temperature requirement protein A n=1 Tax=Lactobacillus agrestimuris TaxID=2941328 RepID=UPI002044A8CE|nr:low temperature requirement protein A [Lactobacillus agrestimuris]
MNNPPLTKRVSMIELFYDLIFAYMISQATGLIHHLDHGTISASSFFTFFLVVIVFINSWMVQSVFTNRYGESSWTDISLYFANMMVLLYMTNSFSDTSYKDMRVFFIAAGILSFLLLLQYLIIFIKTDNSIDKKISSVFIYILLFRTAVLLIGGFLNNTVGNFIAIIGVLISWILPSFTTSITKNHPIIFSHLLERLTLLIIITFGETIIGIADYFKPSTFSIYSILIFLIVAGLFFNYITEFDHLIEEKRSGETGNLLIYLHYFILFGISLITVSLKFISEEKADMIFAISCLYGGMLLFYIGLTISNHYNQKKYQKQTSITLTYLISLIVGYIILIMNPTFSLITIITTIVVILNAAMKVSLLYTK